MSRKFLGLDVRYDNVTAVLVSSTLREIQLERFLSVPIPDTVDRAAGLKAAMEAIQNGMEIDQVYCVAAIPADEFSFRNLKVPFKGDRKIDQVLPFELEPTIPYPLENLVIDFQTIQVPGQKGETNLIAAAALKSTLKVYLDIFASVGIDPQILTPGGYSTVSCINRFADPPQDWILIDIGRDRETLFFITSGEISLIRSIPSFTSQNGDNGLGAKIRQTLLAFENTAQQPLMPEQAFLTGRGLNGQAEHIKSALEKTLSLSVTSVDLIRQANGKVKIATEENWKSGEIDNALALTLAQIEGKKFLNFRRGPFAAKRNWAAYKSNLIRLGVFTAILLCLLGLNVFIDTHALNRKAERIDRQITAIFQSTFPEIQRVVDPVHQMKIAMEDLRRDTFIPGDSGAHVLTIQILEEISKQIPEEIDVEFTRMVINQGDVLISGNTDTFNSVDDIQTRLEKIDLFKKVTINSTNKDQNENRIRFKMKVDL
ncbi:MULTISPECIES: type II secretion system protein GspL [Desulfococcus]|jgi:type II secretory pathway component PulL|uniref:GspL periplasmic domain containing protein n=1 Tax=Desulfococcus multivorans DSM 2059 TaxID=1121405 RepID=S7TP87_DESML|nr:type II secretion system protein GspL [Desulfococcus multivorans]AOY57968.1 GspL: predicted general secretion system pathway protein L [Desulfococcus multivorans]AQV00336.1 hypothetical protein B2D07_05815 [Desulfococcus multivorans]EPR39052.1 GspL periplasmic domain containing protein [Desulfococcus multivorans DSM 2059]MDX9818478.1 type II secretion system protein GspL [Desulfococcus multivorans]SJZ64121.1 Fimbrial assembly protein (PilN) [Desulfococcus multivorans DSM 2059]